MSAARIQINGKSDYSSGVGLSDHLLFDRRNGGPMVLNGAVTNNGTISLTGSATIEGSGTWTQPAGSTFSHDAAGYLGLGVNKVAVNFHIQWGQFHPFTSRQFDVAG